MNERIQELSKQAGDYVNETYTGPVRSKTPGKIWEDGHIGWHTQFNQKFAELIVRECVEICDAKRAEYTKLSKDADNFTDKNLWAEGEISAHRIRILIQEHFGVKE